MNVPKIEEDKSKLRIVFMGTPDFAKESLKALVENGYNVVAVYSQPDKPKGRGMKMQMTDTKEYALSQNIKVYQPVKLKTEENIEEYKSLKPDLTIVVAYGKILSKDILDAPKYGCINIHGSLLPKGRGAAPIQWSIINGENETGITTMFMSEGMDTGDMLEKVKVEITEKDTYETLHDKMKVVGAKLLIKTLEKYQEGTLERTKQPDEFTVAPKILKENMRLDFSKTSKELDCMVRGTNPFPGSYSILIDEDGNEKTLKVFDVEKLEIESEKNPGEIITNNPKQGLVVKTKDGAIKLNIIQAENSKRMTAEEYLRGKKIEGRFKC